MNNDEQPTQSTPPEAPAEPVTPVENVAPPSPFTPAPADVPLTKPLKKKFPILIAAIIAGAVVILGGGTAAAYNLYYQNPDKVVGDALSTTLEAKTVSYAGTVDFKNDDTTVKVTFDGKNESALSGEVNVTADIAAGSTKLTAKGSGLIDKDGNLYFKLQNVKELVDSLLNSSGTTFDTTPFNDLVAKLEDKWIKVSADDLKEYSKDYSKSQTCISDALKSFNTDDAAKKEITTIYKNNQFLIIDKKLGSKTIDGVGSLGYAVKFDNAKSEAFGKAVLDTKIGKQVKACDPNGTTDTSTTASEDKSVTTAELWVSRFGHTVTQFNISTTEDKNSFKATINPVFNKPVTVTAPTDTTTLKQISEDIQKAYTDYYTSLYGTY